RFYASAGNQQTESRGCARYARYWIVARRIPVTVAGACLRRPHHSRRDSLYRYAILIHFMARLLQVFGFLSVLFRGATLTFQSLTVGGIVFLIFVVRSAEEDSVALRQACLRWIRRSALALAAMQISYVLANSIILRQSADMPLRDVLGANFVLAGVIGIVSAFTVIALSSSTRSVAYADLLLPAVSIIAST